MNLKILRMIVIAIAMCVFFALVVENAYKYLPNKNASYPVPISADDLNSIRPGAENNDENENSHFSERISQLEEELRRVYEEKEMIEQKFNEISTKKEQFVEINPEATPIENYEGSYFKEYFDAVAMLEKGNLEVAMEKFQNTLTLAENDKQTAKSYLGVAKVYALQKRYGSAISNAQRSQNLHSTYEAQVMLAKLNYLTGNTSRAEQMMKSILEKEFTTSF